MIASDEGGWTPEAAAKQVIEKAKSDHLLSGSTPTELADIQLAILRKLDS